MFWKNLWRLLTLKPHDEHLADGVVGIWLIFARLNIGSIALCDAIAWAYLGFITASGTAAYATAVVVGLIALTLIGSLDASFVMHDTSAQHAKPLAEREVRGRAGTALAWFRRNVHASHAAVIARILLVVLSFTVTAPSLTQFFFAKDIEAEITRRNEAAEARVRAHLQQKFDAEMKTLTDALAARSAAYEREVAGTGQSRRFGSGPTSRGIAAEIADLKVRIANLDAARAAEIQAFEAASPEERAGRFGVQLTRPGPETRAQVVASMEQSPAFRAMRNNIKWFLVFMFLGLMVLKFFQPVAVKNYYSHHLQAAFDDYLAGLFSSRLAETQQPPKHIMAPGQFVRWYEANRPLLEDAVQAKERTNTIVVKADVRRQALETLSKPLSIDMTKLSDQLAAASQQGETLNRQLAEWTSQRATLVAKIGDQEQELRDFQYEQKVPADIPLAAQMRLAVTLGDIMQRKEQCEQQLRQNKLEIGRLDERIAAMRRRVDENRVQRERIEAQLEEAGEEARELERYLRETRLSAMHDAAQPPVN